MGEHFWECYRALSPNRRREIREAAEVFLRGGRQVDFINLLTPLLGLETAPGEEVLRMYAIMIEAANDDES